MVPDDLRYRVVGLDPLWQDSGFLFRGAKRRYLKGLALQFFLAYWRVHASKKMVGLRDGLQCVLCRKMRCCVGGFEPLEPA